MTPGSQRTLFRDEATSPATAPRFPHTVIRASAGTGKTFQLSNRFLKLAAAGIAPDLILSATFARKAAGEILDRVLIRLAEGVNDPRRVAELAQHLGDPDFSRERCADLLKALLGRLHRLRIGTLDSFFIQFAGSFGLELGLPPGWSICEDLVDLGLRAAAIQEVLENEDTHDVVQLMHLLSKGEVRRSVDQQIGDVVQTLYGTYLESDRNAWHAIARRRELPPHELDAAVAQLEAFQELPNHKSFVKEHQKGVELAQTGAWELFVARGVAAAIVQGNDEYYKRALSPAIRGVYEPLIDHAQAVFLNRVAAQTEASWRLLDRFHAEYERLKQSRRGMRFEDVTRALARGLAGLHGDDVSFRLDAHLAHLLLDEFQDTSLAQWSVLRPFAEEITRTVEERSFFCVGDVKQAIYGWRGGVSAVFEAVRETLPNLASEPLDRSFRSSQPVIDTVNRVFGSLHAAGPLAEFDDVLTAWKERFAEHTTARGELPGYARLITAPRADTGQSQPEITQQYGAKLVAELHAQNPHQSIGVLVRRNKTVGSLIYQLRKVHRIAASEEGGNPLTDSAAVQVVLSALRIADHPGDRVSRFHVAGSPLAETLDVRTHDDQRAALKASRAIRERLLRDGYGRTVYAWAKTLAPHYDEREARRLHQLVELAYAYESEATARADDFVATVEQRKVEDPTAAAVRVMNYHQAKGLQFDVVVLPELDVDLVGQEPTVVTGRLDPLSPVNAVCRYVNQAGQALLPEAFQKLFRQRLSDAVNESLCVLYVALTRAVYELHMVIAPSKESESNVPKTMAGVLRTALADGSPAAPETVLYETDPKLRQVAQGAAPPAAAAVAGTVKVLLAPARAHRARGLKRQSPSGLEGGPRVSLARRMRLDNAHSLERGTLLHAWFEEVPWLDDGEPSDERLREIAGGIASSGIDVERELADFRRMLASSGVRSVLTRDSYASAGKGPASSPLPAELRAALRAGRLEPIVQRERPFALRRDGRLLNGAIDRLVLFLDSGKVVAADIVDYKSDGVTSADHQRLAELVEHYRPQIDAYREAVARMACLDPSRVTARLLFVNAGLVRTIAAELE